MLQAGPGCQAVIADSSMKELRGDVGRRCRTRLRQTITAFNGFADVVVGTHDLAQKGQLSSELVGQAAGRLLGERRKAYNRRYEQTLAACTPA